MTVDDALGDPETETRSGESFRCEEWTEEALLGLRRHASASVGDGDGDAGFAVAPIDGLTSAQVERATGGHRVQCIADEVGENLTDLSLEAMDVSHRTAEAIDVDVRVGDAALVDGEDVADELGEIDLLRAGGLLVEAKGLRGDGRDAAKFDFSCPDVLARLLEATGVLGEVEEVGDGLERIVDLVRDGTGEAADDGELLTLQESQLGFALLRDLQ